MAYLKVNNEKITPELAKKLVSICPFSAITVENGRLNIGSGCKMCKLCVKNAAGAIELATDKRPSADKGAWRGICVYADHNGGALQCGPGAAGKGP